MLSRAVHKKQRGRRWFTALATMSLITGMLVFSSSVAAFDQNKFELDKNATNDLTTAHLGTLKSKANSGATTITVCERQQDPDGSGPLTPLVQPIPATPFSIRIDGETMTVTSRPTGTVSAGGCGFSNPADSAAAARVWTLSSATTAAHAGGSDVTGLGDPNDVVPGNDWDEVYDSVVADPGDPSDPDILHTCDDVDSEATACLWVNDPPGTTVFSTGGSKDDLNVNPNTPDPLGESGTGWKWTDSSVPPSDEILDAFAIKYQTATRQLLYFGADRYATNGAKDMGFWFFHDTIGRNANGTFSGNHTRPTDGLDEIPGNADDTRGDILLLSTFTQGGAVTTIRVFEWVGVGGNTNGTLQLLGSLGDCVPGNVADKGCNTVSNTTVPSPWDYQGSGSTNVADSIYSGGMAEGGIDLTALGLDGCFGSFMAETRSAPEAGAQLKDFALGSFESCSTDLTTTPSDAVGTALTDTDVPVNGLPDAQLGIGVAGVNVTDSALLDVKGSTNFTGHIDFYLCGPIADPATCATGGALISTETANASGTYTSDSANLTSVGRYCWRGEFVVDSGDVPTDTDSSLGECFEVNPVTPTLSTQAIQPPLSAPVSGPVDFGQPVYDKAILTGTAYQPGDDGDELAGADPDYPTINATMDTPANGTITFELKGPDLTTTTADTCPAKSTGTGTNPQDVTVRGDGDYFSAGFTPDAPGDYHWIASYSGDGASSNTLGTTHNPLCKDSDEDVSVRKIPTQIMTKQSWYPNDTATITSSVTGDLLEAGGTVVFELWNNATCSDVDSGDKLYTETETLTGGTNSEEVGTSNGSVAISAVAITTGYTDADTTVSYSWKVTYTPAGTDTAHTGIQSVCDAEHFSITYTNDDGPGSDLP